MRLSLLVTPLVHGAYFDAYLDVATREVETLVPGCEPKVHQVGGMDFVEVDVPDGATTTLRRLSFVQGIFDDKGAPLEGSPAFAFPRSLVFGAKYRGRTNEIATQLALNLALHHCNSGRTPATLLDPLAGRGTTLLWGLRYGLKSSGIEVDAKAPDDLHRHLKRQAKIHRIKHQHRKGSVGPKTKSGAGRFVRYEFGEQSLQLVTGESQHAAALLAGQKFDVVVTDLPYGVQFGGPKGAIEGLVRACASAWIESLRPGGSLAVLFNTYQPSRTTAEAIFRDAGAEVVEVSLPHRVSESIVRDVLIVRRPQASHR
ncbi:MAG: hypothetical protein AAGE52_16410 [Myxococcota bacterium]